MSKLGCGVYYRGDKAVTVDWQCIQVDTLISTTGLQSLRRRTHVFAVPALTEPADFPTPPWERKSSDFPHKISVQILTEKDDEKPFIWLSIKVFQTYIWLRIECVSILGTAFIVASDYTYKYIVFGMFVGIPFIRPALHTSTLRYTQIHNDRTNCCPCSQNGLYFNTKSIWMCPFCKGLKGGKVLDRDPLCGVSRLLVTVWRPRPPGDMSTAKVTIMTL